MTDSKLRRQPPSKKTSWRIVHRVHHSPAEIKYVSDNEVPTKNKWNLQTTNRETTKTPWRPAARAIKHEPVKYEFQIDLLSPRQASERQPSARNKTADRQPEKIWKPTNPNSRRPYNELKLSSMSLVDIVKADQEKHKKERSIKAKVPLYGPWIPADRRYKRGVNWGTINPFPPYDPFLQ